MGLIVSVQPVIPETFAKRISMNVRLPRTFASMEELVWTVLQVSPVYAARGTLEPTAAKTLTSASWILVRTEQHAQTTWPTSLAAVLLSSPGKLATKTSTNARCLVVLSACRENAAISLVVLNASVIQDLLVQSATKTLTYAPWCLASIMAPAWKDML
jgi:hypothetical protein